ncbi:MAG: DJ-1/PfpI family protein [Firmicutes bacterium]|nr:DJ-1/PfpI family protein [Bacillota bacterium]MBQ4370788.1 DJ-1/PfpI family protein [Bacillota bacterium]
MKRIDILLFDDFTALDAFGPAEVLGGLEDCALRFVSLAGGEVGNHLGLRVMTEKLDPKEPRFILLVPGGFGTRPGSGDPELLGLIREAAASSEYLLSVCTGSALLAAAGLLDGLRATSNKTAFEWASGCGPALWDRQARWVRDGRVFSSAGVSAGIDMALGFVSEIYGDEKAESIARRIEYHRNPDADRDIF